MICLCAAVFTACSDDKTDDTNKWFKQPQVGEVSGTTAVVVCATSFAENVLTTGTPGFAYAPIVDSGLGEYLLASEVTVDGAVITCRLTGLSPETTYVGHAFVSLGGQQLESKTIAFQTVTMGDEDRGTPVFGALSVSDVTSSSATLSGSFSYDGDKTISEAYFSYTPAGGAEQRSAVSTTPGAKNAALSGLSESTAYTFSLCVVIDGQTYKSTAKSFTTPSTGGTPPPAGDTKYSGWAELPDEVSNSDYYYAYHLCPDAYVGKTTQKMRNFAVCYSARYRCPVWIAAPMHKAYLGSAKRKDNYIDDPKISCTQNTEYNFGSTNLTRGHMLSSSDRTVTQSTNNQVFYKTNIGPQLQSGFNEGGGLWNNCDDKWVDPQWQNQTDTTYQVLGCYWENESKKVNGTTVPTHYYKVLLRTKNHLNKWVSSCSREELQCIALFFPHNSQHKGTLPSQYVSKGFVMTVADLEKKVGHTFFSNVPNAPKDTYNRADWGL